MSYIQNDELFDILIGKVSSAINRTFLRAFASEGIEITTEQWSVLACLWKTDGVTQQDLCNLTSKDKPSMTRLIDKLERRKLVNRISSIYDRRINLIQLTEAGTNLEVKATDIVQNIVAKTLSNISDEELNTSRNVLKKIMANLK
jgi:DNA-binding MarR family transcriptional regulator